VRWKTENGSSSLFFVTGSQSWDEASEDKIGQAACVMKSLLVINASARTARSITRHLTARFVEAWRVQNPEGEIIDRDLGVRPVPPINHDWVASAYSDPAENAPAKREALRVSDELVDEIFRASAIIVGAPMYNFGMPAQLKAYVDQIIRVGRTFAFNDPESANPYQGLVPSRPLVIVTSKGVGGYEPGGRYAHQNFLEPHLETVFQLIGLSDISFVSVAFEEMKDGRFQRSMKDAEAAIDRLAERMASRETAGTRIAAGTVSVS
jgi:FMN-dependent NADH-azoreductase